VRIAETKIADFTEVVDFVLLNAPEVLAQNLKDTK
jgi:hypothetical protein